MTSVYLICPVRNCPPEERKLMDKYVSDLEDQGYRVHYPPESVDQFNDDGGVRICHEHREFMRHLSYRDEVHVWLLNGKLTEGGYFDFGMAFMLSWWVHGIKFVIANGPLQQTEHKSFENLLRSIANDQDGTK